MTMTLHLSGRTVRASVNTTSMHDDRTDRINSGRMGRANNINSGRTSRATAIPDARTVQTTNAGRTSRASLQENTA